MPLPDSLQALAETSKAWPFEEARKTLARARKLGKTEVIFETGYGPSGLPHIGTFGEVARTTMVRQAFTMLAPDMPTRLICFSDDMDGLRKGPDNVPNAELLGASQRWISHFCWLRTGSWSSAWVNRAPHFKVRS